MSTLGDKWEIRRVKVILNPSKVKQHCITLECNAAIFYMQCQSYVCQKGTDLADIPCCGSALKGVQFHVELLQ